MSIDARGPQRPCSASRHRQVAADVARLHAELIRYGLVVWTAGNVSARVPGADLFVIKPSGVAYDELDAGEHGPVRPATATSSRAARVRASPSSDTAAHAYVYRHMPEVGGVVHTHSTYATAWAARGEPIPCVLTAMADEFGGEIPVGPFAIIGDDSIGRGIVETLSGHRSAGSADAATTAPFTIGKDARDAVKAAVMREDVARTVHIATAARRAACPSPRRRSTRSSTATRTSTASHRRRSGAADVRTERVRRTSRSGSSPAASTCTARRRCGRSPSSPRRSPATLDAAPAHPGARRVEAGADRAGRDPPRHAGGQRRRRGDRRHRLDAHLQPGQDVDRRARRARQAAAAPAHPGQRRRCRGPTSTWTS